MLLRKGFLSDCNYQNGKFPKEMNFYANNFKEYIIIKKSELIKIEQINLKVEKTIENNKRIKVNIKKEVKTK